MESIGPYKIISKLSEGGMGEIFLVQDPKSGQTIALKKMRADRNKKQFVKEATILRKFKHPSILPIYTVDQDLLYYTMPFIEGQTLKDILAKLLRYSALGLPLNRSKFIKQVESIFYQLCEAVAYAHAKGYIHRDLKPSNIMVDTEGKITLLDWGLIMQPLREAKEETISGTLSYLAPEIILGKQPSLQTEIYSLGLILYQMLTLRLPFHRNDQQQFYENLETEVLLNPTEAMPSLKIPTYLSTVAMKCLESDPNKRYKTVTELLSKLKYVAPSPTYAPEPSINQTGQLLLIMVHAGSLKQAQEHLDFLNNRFLDIQGMVYLKNIQSLIDLAKKPTLFPPFLLPQKIRNNQLYPIYLALELLLKKKKTDAVISGVDHLIQKHDLNSQQILNLDCYLIAAYLLDRNWEEAERIVDWYQQKKEKSSLLQTLRKCLRLGKSLPLLSLGKPWLEI